MEMDQILEQLSFIEEDDTIPRNIRLKVKQAITLLQQGLNDMNIDKSLSELGTIVEDPNVPHYTRAQVMTVVSVLENHLSH